MGTPSPFEIGRGIGNNFNESFKRTKDENAIESILSQAAQSGDPQVLQQSIGKILQQVSPERRGDAVQFLQQSYNNVLARQKEASTLRDSKAAGVSPHLPPAVQAQQLRDRAKKERIANAYNENDVDANEADVSIPTSQPSIEQSGIGDEDSMNLNQQHPVSDQLQNPNETERPNKTVKPRGLQALSDEQITRLTGHPDKEVSEPAKQEAKNRIESQKAKAKEITGLKKEVSDSFKNSSDYINKTYDQYEDSLRKDAITDRLLQLDESGQLSPSGTYNLLETLGLKQEWLKNPANEEYTKLALDLLGGGTLQADYGSRILQSEFAVSMKRIPDLSQTPEGRKQIIANIKTMLLPSKLKQQRLAFYIDKAKRENKPLPHDLRGQILKDIKPQLEEAYDQFKKRNGRYKVATRTRPDDNVIEKYYYLANGNPQKAIAMMKEDNYDTE